MPTKLPISHHVNVVFADNGQGLTRDGNVLCEALEGLGCRVSRTRRSHMRPPSQLRFATERVFFESRRLRDTLRSLTSAGSRWDLNIHLESIDPTYLPLARRNWFVPNQEWLETADVPSLALVDLILFKTRHAEQTLRAHSLKGAFLGFTSEDRLTSSPKDFGRFLHVAGWNPYKGTRRLIDLWLSHPEWPTMTVVAQGQNTASAANLAVMSRRLSETRLKVLQNECGVHLAPSEVEGFGHSIGEALSCGAILITSNAPPMNEVVGSSGAFLVEIESSEPMGHGTRYKVSSSSLEAAVETVLRLTPEQRRDRSRCAREAFEKGRSSFTRRLYDLLDSAW
jgi:glycosyltransferase involved in cell wall biosynthesis